MKKPCLLLAFFLLLSSSTLGLVEAQEENQQTKQDNSSVIRPETEFFSNPDFVKSALPENLQEKTGFVENFFKIPIIGNLLGGFFPRTKLWQSVAVPNQNFESVGSGQNITNIWETTVEKEGFLQFSRPENVSFSGSNPFDIFKSGTKHLRESLLPFQGGGISTYTPPIPPTALKVQSPKLLEIFQRAASSQCIPESILLAIARQEAGGSFGYSDSDVAEFTKDGWWITASKEKLGQGYCYNTCSQPGVSCFRGADVQGPMQFELQTWNGIKEDVKKTLISMGEISQDAVYEPNRCNIRDAIIGAAIKIKRNSGTNPDQCTQWPDYAMRFNVPLQYCGSCGVFGCQVAHASGLADPCSAACGIDYCGNVWYLYQKYSEK